MKVLEILMRRDSLTRTEAEKKVRAVKRRMMAAIQRGDYETAEELLLEELGLELDYVHDILS